ncbi:MAG: hypothetical protein WA840_09090 [Caulobacteraceae bacterium]
MTPHIRKLEAEREEMLRRLDWLEGENADPAELSDGPTHVQGARRRLAELEAALRSARSK